MTQDVSLAVLSRIDSIEREVRFQSRFFEVIAGRLSDITHVTIAEAARMFGAGESTIRERFAPHLERIPGGKRDGIPVNVLREAYVSSSNLRAAKTREKRSAS